VTKGRRKGDRSAIDNHQVLEGILWALRTSAHWKEMMDRNPSTNLLAAAEPLKKTRCVAQCLAQVLVAAR
jgi:hypothetical protein